MSKNSPGPLILASSSKYRQNLLRQLGLSFVAHPPKIDEERVKTKLYNCGPIELAEQLALKKAQSLEDSYSCIIGGDQLISFDDNILGKPETAEKAVKMLGKLQGRTHQLITSICVLFRGQQTIYTDIAHMKMKTLSAEQIDRYIALEQPFDCAGSYKIESQGIGLFTEVDCKDFTAIQGIPLMKLASILQYYGYEIP